MTSNNQASLFSRTRGVLRPHWPFALLAALSLALLLTNLGSDYLWADEGDTAVLASNILKFGMPKAWDGVTFVDSDKGARVNDNLIMVSHPWVQYYVAAASFFVFGENTFAARLPFALAGGATILLGYFLTWRLTRDRRAAFCAAALMVLSIPFLLYARQCRYYPLAMFFNCWLIWTFLRMRSARSCVLFAVSAILLFHVHPFGAVPVAVLGFLTLTYRPFVRQRRWFWFAAPAIALLTVPWLALARRGYAENFEPSRTIGQSFARFVQYLIECASITPLIGCVILLAICLVSARRRGPGTRDIEAIEPRHQLPEGADSAFLLVTFATLFGYAVALGLTESCDTLWRIGIRYTPGMIPLMAMVAGILILRAARGRIAVWLPLLLIFGFTNLVQLAAWMPWDNQISMRWGDEVIEAHLPTQFIDRFLPLEQLLFLRDLRGENPGTIATSCAFLNQHAKPGDRLLLNYCAEPCYFYTRLPQVLRILPDYPIYQAARRKGLPEYVFGIDGVRWVVWRPVWDGYHGYKWAEAESQIVAQGGRLQLVATVEETLWENRSNIHFRRFSGGRYLFPRPNAFPAAEIYRVDWPDG